MRFATLLAVVSLLVASAAYADVPPTSNVRALVEKEYFEGPDEGGRQGGDTVADATPITSLPFSDTGTTSGYMNDYDEVCPYSGSTSPDVVYSFTPGTTTALDIDLCESCYDTKVYVYENAVGALVACNDDYCSGSCYPYPYCSRLPEVTVFAGNTYYIVVDGYGGDYGTYILDISEVEPCVVECPEGAYIEDEPPCFDYMNDVWNGGCNSYPEVFEWIEPFCVGVTTVCGTAGTDDYIGYRDTDWYLITLAEATTISYCAEGQFPLLIFLIQDTDPPGCVGYTIIDYALGDPCEEVCLTYTLAPGDYWLWAGTSVFSGVPCGMPYVFTVDGYFNPASGTEQATWGTIKNLYK
jgi:hypothetical protein